MSLIEKGSNVKVHYKGTLSNGTEFDNSHDRSEPLLVNIGSGQLIPGFDNALLGMALGEVKTFTIPCDEAYGQPSENAIGEVPKSAFGDNQDFEIDGVVEGVTPTGEPMLARIKEVNDDNVVLDLNHPLAGEDLTFEVEVIEIEE